MFFIQKAFLSVKTYWSQRNEITLIFQSHFYANVSPVQLQILCMRSHNKPAFPLFKIEWSIPSSDKSFLRKILDSFFVIFIYLANWCVWEMFLNVVLSRITTANIHHLNWVLSIQHLDREGKKPLNHSMHASSKMQLHAGIVNKSLTEKFAYFLKNRVWIIFVAWNMINLTTKNQHAEIMISLFRYHAFLKSSQCFSLFCAYRWIENQLTKSCFQNNHKTFSDSLYIWKRVYTVHVFGIGAKSDILWNRYKLTKIKLDDFLAFSVENILTRLSLPPSFAIVTNSFWLRVLNILLVRVLETISCEKNKVKEVL